MQVVVATPIKKQIVEWDEYVGRLDAVDEPPEARGLVLAVDACSADAVVPDDDCQGRSGVRGAKVWFDVARHLSDAERRGGAFPRGAWERVFTRAI